MNEPQMNQKIQHDISQVKKDMNTLKEDGFNKASEVKENSGRSAENLTNWVKSNAAQLSTGFSKAKDDATKTVVQTSATVKEKVGSGLSQYNAKATKVAQKLPFGLDLKAGMYPWVAVTFALVAGFMLRGALMPRHTYR